jgi:hypothetical protein
MKNIKNEIIGLLFELLVISVFIVPFYVITLFL